MANEENLKSWSPGQSGNPKGRPKGSKNRSTIARKWLDSKEKFKNPLTGEIELLTQEDITTLAQILKAREGDTPAYKALEDSAYGSPVQQIDQTIFEQPIFPDIDVSKDNGSKQDK
jgi:DNA-directed RNA polymerase specialized sigma54-like protein